MSALLEVANVGKRFQMGGILGRQEVRAVDEVSFAIAADKPEIFTIIGESGSGKTTLARMILGLERPSSGSILFRGEPVQHDSRADRLKFMANVQPVFQNPFEAFNPLKRVDRYLQSTARRYLGARDKAAIEAAMDGALQKVGLSLAEIAGRFPHELSGGQLQRVAIARALIPNPPLLIADEPVSMVDASLRANILESLRNLHRDHGVTIIYITHDLTTAYHVADTITVLYRGDVVEKGDVETVIRNPQHAYTRLLVDSIPWPNLDQKWGQHSIRSKESQAEFHTEAPTH